jgi:hypothetical protein
MPVIPAEAGIQSMVYHWPECLSGWFVYLVFAGKYLTADTDYHWIPAFAGMTRSFLVCLIDSLVAFRGCSDYLFTFNLSPFTFHFSPFAFFIRACIYLSFSKSSDRELMQ